MLNYSLPLRHRGNRRQQRAVGNTGPYYAVVIIGRITRLVPPSVRLSRVGLQLTEY